MALPNPSFEPKTPQWRPGAGAPSLGLPSQNCAFCAPKQPFLAQDSPETQSKRANDGKWLLHSTCASIAPIPRAFSSPLLPRYVRETAQKWPKNGLNVPYLCQTRPKPRTGRILGYVAQNRVPRVPIPLATPHFLWFPSLRIAQRDCCTPVPVVTCWSRRAAQPAHGWGQRWVHPGPRGEKNPFFQS